MPFGLARSGQTMNRTRRKIRILNARIDRILLVASIVGPLALYVITMPRNVVLEDDGLFLLAGAHLGIAHPPGYPLHTLIVYLFTLLPFGSVAFLGHLSSAVLGALACGCLYLCARYFDVSSVPALISSWLFASSEHFWSQAIITEVYTLNALFFFCLYALVLLGIRQPRNTWIWITASVVYGLSLTNHWPLMLLSTPGLVLLVSPEWRSLLRRLPLLLGSFLVSTILPYAWMVWRSQQNPFISFYGPIDSLEQFWFFVSRKGYAEADVSPSAGWGDRLAYLEWLGNEFFWQFTFPGFVLAVLGIAVLLRRRHYLLLGSGLLVIIGNSIVLVSLIGYDYDYSRIAVFRPYSLLGYGVLALIAGVGLQYVMETASSRLAKRTFEIPNFTTCVAMVIGLFMVAWLVHSHWRVNHRAHDDFAERFVEMVFDFLPENAALLVTGDEFVPIGYYMYVENRRSDLKLIELQGLVYGDRLFDPMLSLNDKKSKLMQYIAASNHANFAIGDANVIPVSPSELNGIFRQISRNTEEGQLSLKSHSGQEEFFKKLFTEQPSDRWAKDVRNLFMYQYGMYLGVVHFSGSSKMIDSMSDLFNLAAGNYTCLLGMIAVLIQNGDESHWDEVSEWLSKADELKADATSKSMLAEFYNLRGGLFFSQGQTDAAIASFKESWEIHPHPKNTAARFVKNH